MLVIKVELHSAIDGHVEQVGEMRLWNIGGGSREIGNYEAEVDADTWTKTLGTSGVVFGHNRLNEPVWVLIRKMLNNMNFATKGAPDVAI